MIQTEWELYIILGKIWRFQRIGEHLQLVTKLQNREKWSTLILIPAPVKSPANVFGSYLNEDLLAIHTVKLLWA